uniref:Histone H3 n=1 Tax=Macrostomum lignano TaxID=282301 RepID=A0A1I8J2C0_9PLAT
IDKSHSKFLRAQGALRDAAEQPLQRGRVGQLAAGWPLHTGNGHRGQCWQTWELGEPGTTAVWGHGSGVCKRHEEGQRLLQQPGLILGAAKQRQPSALQQAVHRLSHALRVARVGGHKAEHSGRVGCD